MGNHAVCGCDDDPRLYNQECTIGSGNFNYKKMKAFYFLAIILTILSVSQCGPLDFIGNYISIILRADILDIIDCILHNQIIIKDVNIIIFVRAAY